MNLKGLNHFESLFKRAIRHRFEFKAIQVERVLLLFDSDETPEKSNVESYFHEIDPHIRIQQLDIRSCANWNALETDIQQAQPDLIVAPRLLNVSDKSFQHSLGVYLEAITQKIKIPLLILPHGKGMEHQDTGEVLVGTGHQYIDDPLIHFGAYFAAQNHCLRLVHVEDIDTFNYYIDAISRIPEMQTEFVRESLLKELQQRPMHYFEQVQETLANEKNPTKVEIINKAGRVIDVYREIINSHDVHLIVFEADDDSQLAMHSIGYSIAIEFQDIPVLLI